jgi:hypothetical protein
MGTVRPLHIPCPSCGHVVRYLVEPTEHVPQITLLWCPDDEGGCGLPFAVEVRMRVEITYSTCRLTLPSTTRDDCLEDLTTMPGPDPTDF